MTSPTNLQFDACLYWCVWIFFLDPSSFICCVCKYIYWNICCVCKYIYNQYMWLQRSISIRWFFDPRSYSWSINFWALRFGLPRQSNGAMQVANGCWRTRWGSCAVLACMSVSNQLIILHQLSKVAHFGSSSHFEIAALFGRQRCGSIYFDLCFCLGCIDITNNWFECSANHCRATQIHPHIKADHQTYPSL